MVRGRWLDRLYGVFAAHPVAAVFVERVRRTVFDSARLSLPKLLRLLRRKPLFEAEVLRAEKKLTEMLFPGMCAIVLALLYMRPAHKLSQLVSLAALLGTVAVLCWGIDKPQHLTNVIHWWWAHAQVRPALPSPSFSALFLHAAYCRNLC